MSIIKQVTGYPFQFGGQEHTGWLPRGAATPLPTPVESAILDVVIESEPAGFLLCWNSQCPKHCGDNWFETLAEAENAARELFGIDARQWQSVPSPAFASDRENS